MILLTQADLVRTIRKRRRQNQTAFAADLGVAQSTISQYENGSIPPGRSVMLLLRSLAETDVEKHSIEFWLSADQPPAEETPAENIVAQIRQAVGMSVASFAEALKVSQIGLADFESGHHIPSPAVVRRLQAIATKHRRSDLALILSSDDWKISAVFHPGEFFITAGTPPKNPERDRAHALIDEIYASGQATAIDLAYRQLLLSAEIVRSLQKRPGKKEAG